MNRRTFLKSAATVTTMALVPISIPVHRPKLHLHGFVARTDASILAPLVGAEQMKSPTYLVKSWLDNTVLARIIAKSVMLREVVPESADFIYYDDLAKIIKEQLPNIVRLYSASLHAIHGIHGGVVSYWCIIVSGVNLRREKAAELYRVRKLLRDHAARWRPS